jgi:hypothetical protein
MQTAGMHPREVVARVESARPLPDGSCERFAGYGVMGLPFSSGHYLALRRFPANSIGDAYTSVWWRDPSERWTMFSTTPPDLSCARYFGSALERTEVCPIDLRWTSPDSLLVSIPGLLEWQVDLGSNLPSRAMSGMGSAMPTTIWRNSAALALTARMAAPVLGTGKIRLQGKVPNGQWFQANPRQMWLVTDSHAVIDGEAAGAPAPLNAQTRLGDLWLPQRGIFFVGQSYLESFDVARHWHAI